MSHIARFVSYLFHPIFVPLYLFRLLIDLDPVIGLVFSGELRWRFLTSMAVTMILGPIMALVFLKVRGVIDSLTMPELKGRASAYAVVLFFYLSSYILLMDQGLPRIVYALFIGLMITILILALVSLGYKISAHAAAMGGAVAVVSWIGMHYGLWNMAVLSCLLLLAAVVASARLYLQVHDNLQIAAGFMAGFFSLLATLWLMVP